MMSRRLAARGRDALEGLAVKVAMRLSHTDILSASAMHALMLQLPAST